ncbi:MAG TPA: mechanosensitive ion channel family protein [Pilimelia sp.]|nr:mechanosensitive ion channel family protein [Pilimelia sp.]
MIPAQETPASPSPGASCLNDMLCNRMFELTGSAWLAEGSYYILVKPLRIALIVLVAMLARFLLRRAIKRLVQTTSSTAMPTILRPLRERIPAVTPDPDGYVPERRRQRAEAIGSVLGSFVTAIVFSIATLLVLGELGFNLAPLLASAGIAGVALGFGAQTLVKDLIAGLFMLLEDQYGVGDTVDVGEATGVVEAVGLRITTVRDGQGVLWYIRNGEIIRVGNKSQGWAMAVVDMPIGYASVEEATDVLRRAAAALAEDPEFAKDFIEPPEVLGVEQITVDGAIVRTTAKIPNEAHFRIVRELRRRLAEALETSGIAARIAASRMYPRPAAPAATSETGQGGPT